MKLGMILGTGGRHYEIDMELILEAERLGFDSVWSSEAWGSDAVTPAAWVLARTTKIKVGTGIMQMPARTPSCAAMTAITLQHLSGGRFILGLGPSGPQVIEGWYGVPYGRPLTRTREYIAIIRKIMAREEPLTHRGFHYTIPIGGEGTTGLGKPLKSVLHADCELKIVTGAISPAGVSAAAELADGFIPVFMDPERFDIFEPHVNEGLAKAGGGKSLESFDIMPFCTVNMRDDMEAARAPVREHLALYIGGMGARDKNFYNDYVTRLGFEAEAKAIQDAFLAGRKGEALAAVPDALIDKVALVGPKARIVDQLALWKAAAAKRQVDSLLLRVQNVAEARVLAEAVL